MSRPKGTPQVDANNGWPSANMHSPATGRPAATQPQPNPQPKEKAKQEANAKPKATDKMPGQRKPAASNGSASTPAACTLTSHHTQTTEAPTQAASATEAPANGAASNEASPNGRATISTTLEKRPVLDGKPVNGDAAVADWEKSQEWQVVWLPVAHIEPNPFQPRLEFDEGEMQELSRSQKVR